MATSERLSGSSPRYWKIATAFRLMLTATLLLVTWHHAHWSVALTLSGLSAGAEMEQYATRIKFSLLDDAIKRWGRKATMDDLLGRVR